ncbi:MAG: hypothetical protein ISS66_11370 [Desulfobacteraceae bacterium]|nr:hypothetical protein [Desulfobacteraceae bacterium]
MNEKGRGIFPSALNKRYEIFFIVKSPEIWGSFHLWIILKFLKIEGLCLKALIKMGKIKVLILCKKWQKSGSVKK